MYVFQLQVEESSEASGDGSTKRNSFVTKKRDNFLYLLPLPLTDCLLPKPRLPYPFFMKTFLPCVQKIRLYILFLHTVFLHTCFVFGSSYCGPFVLFAKCLCGQSLFAFVSRRPCACISLLCSVSYTVKCLCREVLSLS